MVYTTGLLKVNDNGDGALRQMNQSVECGKLMIYVDGKKSRLFWEYGNKKTFRRNARSL